MVIVISQVAALVWQSWDTTAFWSHNSLMLNSADLEV